MGVLNYYFKHRYKNFFQELIQLQSTIISIGKSLVIYHVNIHLHGHGLGEYLKGQNGSCQVKAQEQRYNFGWGFACSVL